FGIIMFEVSKGERAFLGQENNDTIIHSICNDNTRPVFGERIPEIYVNFASECMDKYADKRPDARKVCDTLKSWMEDKIFEDDNDYDVGEKIEFSGIIISEE
ncbi:12379_t:CDS:1, partial [Racocetra persica]